MLVVLLVILPVLLAAPTNAMAQAAVQVASGITVIVTDPESEFDGRTIRIPAHLIIGNGNNGGSSSSSNNNKSKSNEGTAAAAAAASASSGPSAVGHDFLGDGIVMANSWANFASSGGTAGGGGGPSSSSSSRAKATATAAALQLSGGALEIPPEDLINLTHLHEPAVVYCLRYRYTLDEIYTATGPILLALNPFKDCRRSLYSLDLMRRYWERGEGITSAGTVTATSKSKSYRQGSTARTIVSPRTSTPWPTTPTGP